MATQAVTGTSTGAAILGNDLTSKEDIDKILDLNTTNSQLLDIFDRAVKSGDSSDATLQKITMAMQMRNNMSAAISNLFRVLADSARLIIQNIRS